MKDKSPIKLNKSLETNKKRKIIKENQPCCLVMRIKSKLLRAFLSRMKMSEIRLILSRLATLQNKLVKNPIKKKVESKNYKISLPSRTSIY